jgi:hypothetical protein
VRKNGDLRFRSITLSQPFSGNSSNFSSHAAPALLTRMSSWGSRSRKACASSRQPSTVDMSWGSEMHVPPSAPSSAAVASHAVALRDEMYTLAPELMNPAAIILPMPREPPVTSATRPSSENRSFIRQF